jgi:hypothetical protein
MSRLRCRTLASRLGPNPFLHRSLRRDAPSPEDLAALERIAETIAAALPEDALAALTTCRFCDERRCIDCPMEVFGLLEPPGSSTATA